MKDHRETQAVALWDKLLLPLSSTGYPRVPGLSDSLQLLLKVKRFS